MRPQAEYVEALRLHRIGLNASEIGRRMGIPRATVRDWLKPRYVPKSGRLSRGPRLIDLTAVPKHDYAYLLGVYLGDGTISLHRKGVYRLRIFMDSRYPAIIAACAEAMAAVMPSNRVSIYKKPYNCV